MKITTKGIGAHDQDLEIRRLNLLVGPNGSGKSKLAEAIRMLALGYVPALGKRPVDLAALMQGEMMSVELSLDGGRTVRRAMARTATGYQMSAEASWLRNAKPTECAKEILGLFGDEEQDVAECLDIRQLLSATPNQRAARIEQLLNAAQRSADEIADAVARLWIMRLADTTEDRMPAEYMKAFELIPQPQQPIVREVAPMLYGKIKEAGITGSLTWANAEKRDAAEGLKKKSAAADELRKRAAQVPEPDERDIMRLEGEKTLLNQDLGAVRQRWTDYRQKAAAIAELREQLVAVQEHAERTNQLAQEAEGVHGKAAADLRERSDQVLEKMGALKMPPEEDEKQARDLQAEALKLSQKADAIDLPNVPDTTKQERAVADLQARLKLAEMSEWGEVLKIAEELEDGAVTRGAKTAIAKSVKRLRELARKGMGADPEELKHELDLAKKALDQAIEKRDKANADRELAGNRRQELCKESDEKTAEAIRLRSAMAQRRREALQAFDAKRTELALERQKLEKALETHKRALEASRNEKAMVDRRLASLQDQVRGAGELPSEPPKPDAIEAKLEGVQTELAKLIAARATHREIHEVLNAIEAAKAGAVVYTAIEWALQRQREIEISNAGGPLIRAMADFLRAAGRTETAFIRASQGNCAIGWKNSDGREVQIQALSGGEWVLFAAALTAAVILCRKSTLKILLVEAGETDARTLTQLLNGIAGVDQSEQLIAIVMTPRAPEHLGTWTMYRTFQDQEAAAGAAA